MLNQKLDRKFWRGKRVLLTGHTGFKGSWMAIWLNSIGAEVVGIAEPPSTIPNLFDAARVGELCSASYLLDIRENSKVVKIVKDFDPEIVFHFAAQPLVRASYRDPIGTFSTNVMGTVNLLDALRDQNLLRVVVVITTDKVYQNHERVEPYSEDDALGGDDPYSASKAACEMVVNAYRKSYFEKKNISVATARAGNVIGGGDWSEDRLIPDLIRAWEKKKILEIRKPQAIRPWQHVLDPLNGYLTLAQKMFTNQAPSEAFNFGPRPDDVASVESVIEMAREILPELNVFYQKDNVGPHEAGLLNLDSSKSLRVLGCRSFLTLSESLRRTLNWYLKYSDGFDARVLCNNDLSEIVGANEAF
jgi:CDP-glucose 4,6-dehydratase